MKIKLNQLRQIIREEVQRLSEGRDDMFANMKALRNKRKDNKDKRADADYPTSEDEARKYFDLYQAVEDEGGSRREIAERQMVIAKKYGFTERRNDKVEFKKKAGGRILFTLES